MELKNETPFEVVYLPGRMGYPDHSITVVVKGTYDLVPDVPVPLAKTQMPMAGDEGYADDEEGSGGPRYDSDFVHFKPAADAVLVGKCHVPGTSPVPSCNVSFQVGSRTRSLRVSGERVWRKELFSTKASDPQVFRELDLRYERSYGGPGFQPNPIGKGIKILEVNGHRVQLLPNIEDPRFFVDSPKSQAPPAGFGPLSRSWGLRADKIGTYGKRWFKERSPWFPLDIDWSTFNCAPKEMQFAEYLRGDEEIGLVNIHPEHETFRCRLPGTRTRSFLLQASSLDSEATTLREIDMKLDTLWIDAEGGQLVLVWRGHTKVLSNEFEDVDHVFVVSESLADPPAPIDRWEIDLRKSIEMEKAEPSPVESREAERTVSQTAEPDDDEDDLDVPDLETPNAEATPAQLGPEERKMMARIMKVFGHTDAELVEAGVAPEDVPPDTPEERALQTQLAQEFGITKFEEEEPEEESEDGWTRQRVVEHAAAKGSFASENLKGLDLSGLSLEDLDFSHSDLSGSDLGGANLARSNLSGANLRRTRLVESNLQEASLTEATLIEAVLTRATLKGATLESIVVRRAECEETDFQGVQAAGAEFVETNLRSASFERASLKAASFRNCVIDGARFSRACLESADLTGSTSQAGTVFDRSDLTEALVGPKTRLVGASFRQVEAPRSVWSGSELPRADFSYATLTEAIFGKTDLEGATLYAATAKGAVFYKTRLRTSKLTKMNLFNGILEYADLREADLSGSNMYGADFSDSLRDRIVLDGTILDKTILEVERG